MDITIGAQLLVPKNPIYTRSGWEIPQAAKLPQKRDAVKIRADVWKDEWRKNLILRSTSPYPYNCVGMVFAARRAYIEIQHVYEILRNDYYHMVERIGVMAGDVVLYKNGPDLAHVGLILEAKRVHPTSPHKDILVLSKWGDDGEFIHHVENVPDEYGQPAEFYTERSIDAPNPNI